MAGIYPFVLSLLICITAMEFAFPEASKRLTYSLTRTPLAARITVPEPGRRRLPIDTLIDSADRALEGRIRRVSFPRTPGAPLMVRKEWEDWNQTRNHANIAVDPFTGRVLSVEDTRKAPLAGKLIQWCIPIHFGLWGGLLTRVLYVFVGLAWPAAFVTGVWHWVRRPRARPKPRLSANTPASISG